MARPVFIRAKRRPAHLLLHVLSAGPHALHNIAGEKGQEVAGGRQHRQAGVPSADDKDISEAQPHHEGEPLDLHRQDEKEVELEVGVQERKRQEDRDGEERVAGGLVGREKRDRDRQRPAEQKKQVESEKAPVIFQRLADHVEEIPADRQKHGADHGQLARHRRHKREGEQPPEFTLQDQRGHEQDPFQIEPPEQGKAEEHHLPADQVERELGDREAAEGAFEAVE